MERRNPGTGFTFAIREEIDDSRGSMGLPVEIRDFAFLPEGGLRGELSSDKLGSLRRSALERS